MALFPRLLLLSIIPTALSQYSSTRLDVNGVIFTSNQPFLSYFPAATNGNGMTVQCECTASSGSGQAVGSVSKSNPVNNGDRSSSCGDMSFELFNPADWATLTCSVRLRIITDSDAPLTVTDFVQLYAAQNDDAFAPNSYPVQKTTSKFPDHPDWTLAASINKRCTSGNSNNFNCDDRCQSVLCNNNANICCTDEVDADRCTCITALSTCAPPSSTPDSNGDPNEDFCANEDLYFWIMIGLACLSGLLLILLIICLSYICCALSSEDKARQTQQLQQQQQTEAARPPPPVYLSTPPRDPRYGYRGPPPLDPYGRPEAGYREEYVGVPGPASSSLEVISSQDADIDSLAGEWTDASTRREARV
ncbi:hypothetical protein PENTCL1PPCAC_28509 [Pristionchus entomophagus]|uniref:CUB domain-containing protein n=1 Tax=Pristionchus entomophagus TaxID=358040 RepID=A0AAV5UH13_9BILA|nr:hypothetical protein PENTCL1PPCAC_28509 [Pristionchus entomophagus]